MLKMWCSLLPDDGEYSQTKKSKKMNKVQANTNKN